MNRNPFLLSVSLIPMICLGSVSCTALKKGQVSYQEWQEKREQRKAEKQLAKAEKAAGLTEERPLADAQAPAVFLDYDNPNGVTAAGVLAEGNRSAGWKVSSDVPGGELPASVGELTNTVTTPGETAGGLVFREDVAPGSPDEMALDPDLIRAWAGSIAQVTGASLAEPLITAAMTASMARPTVIGFDRPEPPDSMRRSTADAFAGQPSVGLRTSEHEADWSTRE